MTENEAIKYLRQINPKHIECVELVDMKEAWNNIPQAVSVVERALTEIQQYRSIGTVEECREAVEKQRGKKPRNDIFSALYNCPNCKEVFSCREDEYFRPNFCPNCGQAISWEESED